MSAVAATLLIGCASQLPGGWWSADWSQHGALTSESLGLALLGHDDVDGDGVTDLVALALDPGLIGRVDILSGASGARLAQAQHPGSVLARGADLDGDGIAEVLLGNPLEFHSGTYDRGAVRALSGRTLQPLQSWLPASGDRNFGFALCRMGDHDGDGVAEVAVSSPSTFPYGASSGRVELRSGANGSLLDAVDSPALEGFGWSLAPMSDGDGDGLADLAVGAPDAFGRAGAVAVVGSRDFTVLRILPGVGGERFGSLLASAGDLQGDGGDELLVAAGDRMHLHDGATGAWLRTFFPPSGLRMELRDVVAGRDFDADGGLDYAVVVQDSAQAWRVLLQSVADDGFRLSDLDLGWNGSAARLTASPPSGATSSDALLFSDASRASPLGAGSAGWIVSVRYAPGLRSSPHAVRAARGGSVVQDVDFPVTEAGIEYLLLVSGAPAGVSEFAGLTIPLRQDGWFARVLATPPPAWNRTRGRLDAAGDAAAVLTIPAGAAAGWIGRTLRFSAISGAGGIGRMASAAQHLTILP